MKKYRWQISLGMILISLSTFFYFIHYLIFRDAYQIFYYLLSSIAFIPIDVFLVTVVIDKLIERREKQSLLQKLNMVIGIFFSEVGTELLRLCTFADPNIEIINKKMHVNSEWCDNEFKGIMKDIKNYEHQVDIKKIDKLYVKNFLYTKRNFLLSLLGNPSLLEHDSFTELLQSVFHLQEELQARLDINKISKEDEAHLQIDIIRVYRLISYEWLVYMQFLKNNYPYLFYTAMINNPYETKKDISCIISS